MGEGREPRGGSGPAPFQGSGIGGWPDLALKRPGFMPWPLRGRSMVLEAGGKPALPAGESYARGFRPVAVCKTLWLARLLAAVLPATGRDPAFRLRSEPGLLGYGIESRADWGEPVAWLELFNDDIPPALHIALCLARSPESLKLLLAAAGGVALELTGVGLDAMYEEAPAGPAL
jgi:hypothetical protein